ncbi:cell division protein ZapA [Azospirillum thermophilum]|uniref:Cell division protein ZapA n=1 Tax=Azospirillum thermophilum TaxID=2202148 RepID=A0A2S2CM10_9PROT|nr:cell division protein ZapA [Azospirillum thermophilum]AWK85534.1 cell division protein ZapA [Azospirillum thermophilum]
MPQVDIEINNRLYRMGCQEGQEGRLRELAAYVDRRLKQLTGGGKLGSEAQMLVMTCLVLADEMQDMAAGRGAPAGLALDEAEVAAGLDQVARRIEEVAARLERA